MKRVMAMIVMLVVPLIADSDGEMANPVSLKAEAGKDVYRPIRKAVDLKDEKQVQQENGVMGGRSEPMHSYPPVSDKNLHQGHR